MNYDHEKRLVMIQDKAGCRLVQITESGGEILILTFPGRVTMKRYCLRYAGIYNLPLYNRKKTGLETLVWQSPNKNRLTLLTPNPLTQ